MLILFYSYSLTASKTITIIENILFTILIIDNINVPIKNIPTRLNVHFYIYIF